MKVSYTFQGISEKIDFEKGSSLKSAKISNTVNNYY